MEITTPPLTILPPEILQEIMQYCSLSDLQRLRLCCRTFSHACETRLFHTIVLVPHIESFKRFRALSGHPRLNSLVRRLIYDPRVILHDDHFSAWNAWQSGEIFLIEHNRARFNAVVQNLPRLEQIKLLASDNQTLPQPAFYARISARRQRSLRLQAVTPEAVAATLVSAVVTTGKSMQAVQIDGVRWQLVAPVVGELKERSLIPDDIFDCLLTTSRGIEFKFQRMVCRMLDESDLEASYCRLASKLSNRPNLEKLSIRFIHEIEWSQELDRSLQAPDLLPAHLFGPGSCYPRLKSLSIDAYLAYEKPWLQFLVNVAPTLKSLRLSNIGLCTDPPLQPCTLDACWVRTLKAMQGILSLEEIDFSGTLASSGGQRWSLFDMSSNQLLKGKDVSRPESLCLKAQVLHWFLNGGDCPLDRAALKPPALSGQSAIDHSLQRSWKGDWSWRVGWVPEVSS